MIACVIFGPSFRDWFWFSVPFSASCFFPCVFSDPFVLPNVFSFLEQNYLDLVELFFPDTREHLNPIIPCHIRPCPPNPRLHLVNRFFHCTLVWLAPPVFLPPTYVFFLSFQGSARTPPPPTPTPPPHPPHSFVLIRGTDKVFLRNSLSLHFKTSKETKPPPSFFPLAWCFCLALGRRFPDEGRPAGWPCFLRGIFQDSLPFSFWRRPLRYLDPSLFAFCYPFRGRLYFSVFSIHFSRGHPSGFGGHFLATATIRACRDRYPSPFVLFAICPPVRPAFRPQPCGFDFARSPPPPVGGFFFSVR